jgi:NMD protein affecting ribosome stability and mRNA decay
VTVGRDIDEVEQFVEKGNVVNTSNGQKYEITDIKSKTVSLELLNMRTVDIKNKTGKVLESGVVLSEKVADLIVADDGTMLVDFKKFEVDDTKSPNEITSFSVNFNFLNNQAKAE